MMQARTIECTPTPVEVLDGVEQKLNSLLAFIRSKRGLLFIEQVAEEGI